MSFQNESFYDNQIETNTREGLPLLLKGQNHGKNTKSFKSYFPEQKNRSSHDSGFFKIITTAL